MWYEVASYLPGSPDMERVTSKDDLARYRSIIYSAIQSSGELRTEEVRAILRVTEGQAKSLLHRMLIDGELAKRLDPEIRPRHFGNLGGTRTVKVAKWSLGRN